VINEHAETRCSHCPVGEGSRCKGQEIRRLCELVDPTSAAYNPAYKPLLPEREEGSPDPEGAAGAGGLPSVSESLALLRRLNACPDRFAETTCGCAGLARCARGQGRQGLVNHLDCFQCLRADAESAAGPLSITGNQDGVQQR
jgi:hypothetical protein